MKVYYDMKRPLPVRRVREAATLLLAKVGVESAPIPIETIARYLGARVNYHPFEGELAGMLVQGDGQIVIGVNSLHHQNRQRFTIAHECGHLVLKHHGEVHIDRSFIINRRDAISSLATDAAEIDANRFAAELLMPFELVRNDLDKLSIDAEDESELRELARKYRVSVQAMTYRVTNVLSDWL